MVILHFYLDILSYLTRNPLTNILWNSNLIFFPYFYNAHTMPPILGLYYSITISDSFGFVKWAWIIVSASWSLGFLRAWGQGYLGNVLPD